MLDPRYSAFGRVLSFLAVAPLVMPFGSAIEAAEPRQSALSVKTRQKTTKAQEEPQEKILDGEGICRLNFFNKPWDQVLEKVAADTNSELVMPVAPPGRFTRSDLEKHNRESVVRVLNRDLSPKGFRLIEDNEKLIVISTRKEKQEYPAGQIRDEEEQKAEKQLNAVTFPSRRPITDPRKSSNRVQNVSYEEESAENLMVTANDTGVEVTTPQAKQPVSSITITPKHRSALDLAKQLHQTFDSRAQLENSGPNGLPALVVNHFNEEEVRQGRPLFVLEIDTTENSLTLTATPQVQNGLRELVKRLDANPITSGAAPVLMAGDGTLADTGRKMSQPLQLISQSRAQGEPESSARPNESALQGLGGPNSATTPLPALLGNLRGNVSIEAMGDLDILVLRGNQEDVNAVQQVIRAIEAMAVGSMPEIHLLRLQFVDSESLSQLLNDVYTQMSNLRTNQAQRSQASVRILPVVTPNAMLVMAPSSAMRSVLELAQELDRPIDPTHEVHIFRLKHGIASSVSELLVNFYTQPPTGLGTRLRVAADDRTNSVIVQANPRDLSEITEFIKGVDSEQSGSVSRMKTYEIKSAVAQELADFLNNALQSALNPPRTTSTTGGVQNFQQQGNNANQSAKATVLEFLKSGSDELIRSGLLNDIRFNAEVRTNTLLVTAPEQSLPLIDELVRLLDRPSTVASSIKIFPLRNADAEAAVTLLQSLFASSATGTTGGAFGANNQQQNRLGFELAGAQGSGANLVPVRFTPDYRTNSVVAIGGVEVLQIVEAILVKLDASSSRDRQTTVLKLRNSPVEQVATAINNFLTSQRELSTLDPNRTSTSQLLEQEIIVTAELETNSLIISATPQYLPQIMELAKRLDAEPQQVMIQALLVEVTLNHDDEFGVELGFQDPVLFARSAITNLTQTTTSTNVPGVGTTQTTNIISQDAVPGFAFNNSPLGNNNSNAATNGIVGGQGLSHFGLGRSNSDLGYGGLVLSASSESVSVLIRALAARRTVRVLSRPQIIALDNQAASIQVGQNVPVPTGVTFSQSGLGQTTVEREDAGIMLTVRPRISPEGQIVMTMAAEKSAFPNLSSGVAIGTDAQGNPIYSPVKEVTTADTTVKVPDGQTVVVGGMIYKEDGTIERKVPWLGDLPVVGRAFRYDSHTTDRRELLIFLTPRIIHNDGDAEMLKSIEAQRLHYFQDDAESLHGPLFGLPKGDLSEYTESSPPLKLAPALPHEIPASPPPLLTPEIIDSSLRN